MTDNNPIPQPVITVGMGELGSVFSRGLLKLGHPVIPVTRQHPIAHWLAQDHSWIQQPLAVLVCVGEADLATTLTTIPSPWADRVVLIQNELLPNDWQCTHLVDPTVISVWFEKKAGMDSKVIQPSPLFGIHAPLIQRALATLHLPVRMVDSAQQLLQALLIKNLYILTTNIAGLKVGGNVQQLSTNHVQWMNDVFEEVLRYQQGLIGDALDLQQPDIKAGLYDGMLDAFHGDPEHQCMGRSAPARLARLLDKASAMQLNLPLMANIQTTYVK